MKEEVVRHRAWLAKTEFLDLLGATNLLPGPTSTQMAMQIGFRRAGWPGLAVAGVCFILPAAVFVLALAAAYVRFSALPRADAVLHAVKPVIVAIIARAIWSLARTAIHNRLELAGALVALALALTGADPLFILFGLGALAASLQHARARSSDHPALLRLFAIAASMAVLPTLLTRLFEARAPATRGALPLFLFFLKIGTTIYGGGYVLAAFLRDGLVHQWHWITEAQLLDSIAVGQFTPGPLFSTATFIGYLTGGLNGAAVATLAIFAPSFLLVGLTGPLLPRLRQSQLAGAFLDGVNLAAVALMASVTLDLGHAAVTDALTLGLALACLVILSVWELNALWLIAAAAAIGLASGG